MTSNQGVLPPGSAPPYPGMQQQYIPPQQGGYPGAPPQGVPPQQQGGYPGAPPQGVPPQQGGYPGGPPQGVPPQQGGYPGAPPQGVPPQQGTYPGGVPPQQGGYPGALPQGVPPQQGGYPGLPPQGVPQQQGGYPGGPPQDQAYLGAPGVQPRPATPTAVIQATPHVGKDPVTMVCPSCRAQVTTRAESSAGPLVWMVCGGMFLAGFVTAGVTWLCCCFPFCMSSMQDTSHHCPNCGHFIGKHKAIP